MPLASVSVPSAAAEAGIICAPAVTPTASSATADRERRVRNMGFSLESVVRNNPVNSNADALFRPLAVPQQADVALEVVWRPPCGLQDARRAGRSSQQDDGREAQENEETSRVGHGGDQDR